ncbi:hypothetical protein [Streptomyces sp. NPDC006012]|uniref:hypothetical protein n=1 Tax=Streptomyces sp. NPDC006012 TaxID=3364739 RepID=UPI0036C6D7AD
MSTSSAPLPEPAVPYAPVRRPRAGRARRRWHPAPAGVLAALALFVAVRAAGVVAVAVTSRLAGRPLTKNLAHSWDSTWYLHIATHGYGRLIWITKTGEVQTDWAFFPLYPALVRAVTTVVPLSPGAAGLLLAWSAAVVAAWGVYAIGHHVYGRAVATALVALWASLPHSVVLTLAYTEPLFAALAAWCLYAVLKGRWLTAGALAALAGLSRPSGIAAVAAVLVAAGHETVRRRGRVPPGLWAGAVLAPLGWVGYVLWVGRRTGDLFHGYFRVQSAWSSRLDLGIGALRFLKALFLHGGGVVYPLALVVVAAGVLLFGLLCLERAPLPLVVFAGALVLLVVAVSGPFASKPRFLLPAFPLLVPVARALVRTWRTRRPKALLLGGTLTAVSLAYGTFLTAIAHQPL